MKGKSYEKKLIGTYICSSKRVFKKREWAWKQARQDFIMRGILLGVYNCNYCKQYHLTKRHGNSFPKEFIEYVEEWLGFKTDLNSQ